MAAAMRRIGFFLRIFGTTHCSLPRNSLKTANVVPIKYIPAAVGVSSLAVGADGSFADVAFSPPRRISADVMAMMLASMTLGLVNTDARNECKQAGTRFARLPDAASRPTIIC